MSGPGGGAAGGGGSFHTELPTMQAASQHVYEVNEQIQAQLTRLLARLDPLASTWQGTAAASFQALKQRWLEDANTLNRALRGIGDGLAQSHAAYQTAEDTSQQDITAVSGQLG